MKRFLIVCLAACLLFALAACKEELVPPEADVDAAWKECYPGLVTEMFTEGSGADAAQVVVLTMEKDKTVYVVLTEETACLFYDAATGETASAGFSAVQQGCWVEAEVESLQGSAYHPASEVRVFTALPADELVLSAMCEPPALTVCLNNNAINAFGGGFTWRYTDENGECVVLCADALHPLQAKEMMPVLSVLPTTVSSQESAVSVLRFDVVPDRISVRRWAEDAWGDPDAESVAVETDGFLLPLEYGAFIYEVTAEWYGNDACGGTAYYSFCTAVPQQEDIIPVE